MNWHAFDNGQTIGQPGSENGIIIRDDEHDSGARITLERDSHLAPFAITCGIYGWMFHTRFFRAESEARDEYELMKAELSIIISTIPLENDIEGDSKTQSVTQLICEFVSRFP